MGLLRKQAGADYELVGLRRDVSEVADSYCHQAKCKEQDCDRSRPRQKVMGWWSGCKVLARPNTFLLLATLLLAFYLHQQVASLVVDL